MKHLLFSAALFFLLLLSLPDPGRAEGLFLRKIDFDRHPDGSERACFAFTADFSPDLFALEGDRPRVVVDVSAVSGWDGKAKFPVAGKLAQRIRCYYHRDTRKLRIVVDLDPAFDFVVDPVFDQKRHILCLKMRRRKPVIDGTP